jgi:hypothetical protein
MQRSARFISTNFAPPDVRGADGRHNSANSTFLEQIVNEAAFALGERGLRQRYRDRKTYKAAFSSLR